jgi:PIN like domain
VKSRRSSGRRRGHAPPPEFLIDRSLGRVTVPAALRGAGLTVWTLAEIYGEAGAQEVGDREWIALAGERGWAYLSKDDRIRRRPAELQALIDGGVRAFCLTNGNLGFDEQAEWFVRNRHRIIQRCRKPGPYVYGVYRDRLGKLWPRD